MGDIIRKNASAQNIFADVSTSLIRARARGGLWAELADQYLADVARLAETVSQKHDEATATLVPLQAAARAEDERADDLLGRVADEIWNAVGRPASDPALSVLFPGGIVGYSEGDLAGQPDRMRLLAELLEAGVHPRLAPDVAQAKAAEIRQAAEALAAVVTPLAKPTVRASLSLRVRTSVAVVAQMRLASFKRALKARSCSEADIHQVIPDRPRDTRETTPAPQAG